MDASLADVGCGTAAEEKAVLDLLDPDTADNRLDALLALGWTVMCGERDYQLVPPHVIPAEHRGLMDESYLDADESYLATLIAEAWEGWEYGLDDRFPLLHHVDITTAPGGPVEMLVEEWLPLAMHCTVFGPKEQGKTWLLLGSLVAPLLRAGQTVAYIDFEMSRGSILERLLALGVPREMIAEHFLYFEAPLLDGSADSKEQWRLMLAEMRPVLVSCDAGAGAYAAAGLDEDKTRDVLKWDGWYLTEARRMRASTVMLDHTGHESKGRARGASGKGAHAKVEFEVSLLEAFGRDRVGKVKVARRKNTLAADIPEERIFLIGGTPLTFEQSADVFHAVEDADAEYRGRIERIVIEAGAEGLNVSGVRDAVHEALGSADRSKVSNTLAGLAQHPGSQVRVRDGARNSKVYYFEPSELEPSVSPTT